MVFGFIARRIGRPALCVTCCFFCTSSVMRIFRVLQAKRTNQLAHSGSVRIDNWGEGMTAKNEISGTMLGGGAGRWRNSGKESKGREDDGPPNVQCKTTLT